ncbi:MAG: Type II secretion system protein E [Clostridia bacterium 62_21]|nr:MAG: Type II secretion system protein E [Clostridia bacterium 62_21]
MAVEYQRLARENRPDVHRERVAAVHKKVIAALKNLPAGADADRDLVRRKVVDLVYTTVDEQGWPLARADRQRIAGEVLDEILGFGPITPLLNDPEVTEVMVNGPDQVYVEKYGRLQKTDVTFRDAAHVMRIIEKIVAPVGRRVDESMPMVDARLPDGSRVNVIIPPLSLKGPTITIRKFYRERLGINDLIKLGTLTPEIAQFLEACVRGRLNIIVSGGTGSGKTTTLNVLSSFIPSDERIVTIEDAAELQLQQEHVVPLESRPPNIEGKGQVTIRDLVRNALRMRPDRIIVGEVRGGEALDMLQAMNTGHEGSLSTVHANSPRDALARIETMVLMAGMELPVRAIREQIAAAIDLIVHQSRLKDGSRRITHVTEVQGLEGQVVLLQELFVFRQKGVRDGRVVGEFAPTGIRPRFTDKLEARGIELPNEIFLPAR